jgi:uncharacterized membrane protein
MTLDVRTVLTLLCAVGSAIVGGVFFAFSTFVMTGLGRLPAAHGIAAMQAINVAAITPPFMAALFGTGVACAAAAALAVFGSSAPGAAWQLTGSLLYLAGNILVTIVCNVPRNDALAAIDPSGPDSAARWKLYLKEWTAWNHVRTVTALGAAASFIAAL